MTRLPIVLAIALAAAAANAQTVSQPTLRKVVDVIGSPRPGGPMSPNQPGYGGNPSGQPPPGLPPAAQPPGATDNRQPMPLANCNAGGCWDSQGNRYNATGDRSRFINGEGRLCNASGKFITCN